MSFSEMVFYFIIVAWLAVYVVFFRLALHAHKNKIPGEKPLYNAAVGILVTSMISLFLEGGSVRSEVILVIGLVELAFVAMALFGLKQIVESKINEN